jgi:hypothetical protein
LDTKYISTKKINSIQQFKSSSEPSKQSEAPSHCHETGKHSKVSSLVLHKNSDDLHLTAKT